jgi:hypothetical protein
MLSYSLFQTSQTGGQWYSDTYPFSIPCITIAIQTKFLIEQERNLCFHKKLLEQYSKQDHQMNLIKTQSAKTFLL